MLWRHVPRSRSEAVPWRPAVHRRARGHPKGDAPHHHDQFRVKPVYVRPNTADRVPQVKLDPETPHAQPPDVVGPLGSFGLVWL